MLALGNTYSTGIVRIDLVAWKKKKKAWHRSLANLANFRHVRLNQSTAGLQVYLDRESLQHNLDSIGQHWHTHTRFTETQECVWHLREKLFNRTARSINRTFTHTPLQSKWELFIFSANSLKSHNPPFQTGQPKDRMRCVSPTFGAIWPCRSSNFMAETWSVTGIDCCFSRMARRCSSIKTEEITAHSSGRILPLRLAKGEGEPSSHKGGLSVCLPAEQQRLNSRRPTNNVVFISYEPCVVISALKASGVNWTGWVFFIWQSIVRPAGSLPPLITFQPLLKNQLHCVPCNQVPTNSATPV